jgi:60 kDa SS-A/Ro ribonucleoprotein
MANKALFKSLLGRLVPATAALNEELAPAYAFPPRHALAQYAATGCLNSTFYASADTQLEKVLGFCGDVDAEFIARTALYCRKEAWMKDAPALLCAVLSVKSPELLARVFPRVIDNGKMLRSFVQIMRSGAVGRKSLGSAPKRLVRQWLESRDDNAVFRASVGQSPSLADVIKMVHPRPADKKREALYGYLIGKEVDSAKLPESARQLESYKKNKSGTVPNVPFEMLTALDLGTAEWTQIARNATWQMTRMNLNTFARHGVFGRKGMPEMIAERLRDPKAVASARVFPFQLLSAYRSVGDGVPTVVAEALQDAMELAIGNVAEHRGSAVRLPRRVRLDVLSHHGHPEGIHLQGAVRGCGRADGGGSSPGEPGSRGPALRERRREHRAEPSGYGDDQRRKAGRDHGRRNQLLGAALAAEQARGQGKARGPRVG